MMGYRIADKELHGEKRDEYGAKIINKLSKELSTEYGKGFTKTNLYNFYLFYKTYPEIFHSASVKSQPILSWTHYHILLQVKDEKAREWYEKESLQQAWSVRTLQRNVSSQYYYRMFQTQKKEDLTMPQVFKIGSYWVYFWANDNEPLEPVHVHIAQGNPTFNATKVWITRAGKCLLCNNNLRIPEKVLRNIIRIIEARSNEVVRKWEDFFGEIKYYC